MSELGVHSPTAFQGNTVRLPKETIQINHYRYHDEHYTKLYRWPRQDKQNCSNGLRLPKEQYRSMGYDRWMSQYNAVKDRSIQRFLPALKKNLSNRFLENN